MIMIPFTERNFYHRDGKLITAILCYIQTHLELEQLSNDDRLRRFSVLNIKASWLRSKVENEYRERSSII